MKYYQAYKLYYYEGYVIERFAICHDNICIGRNYSHAATILYRRDDEFKPVVIVSAITYDRTELFENMMLLPRDRCFVPDGRLIKLFLIAEDCPSGLCWLKVLEILSGAKLEPFVEFG